jgi:hypothetical protein
VLGQRFKIILLIRDPRAIINSLLKAPHEWTNLAPNPKMACTNIYNDLTAYNRSQIATPMKMSNNDKINLYVAEVARWGS